MASPPRIFDTTLVTRHWQRRALSPLGFLLDEISARFFERLQLLQRHYARTIILNPLEPALLQHCRGLDKLGTCWLTTPAAGGQIIANHEALPFAAQSVGAVLSYLSLHWVNDVPGLLKQIAYALQPDGLFMAVFFGGNSLQELRHALHQAEAATQRGYSPRVSPFMDARDMAGLLQRAGFALPVTDTDKLTLFYPNLPQLLADLRAMGQSNALLGRYQGLTTPDFFARVAAYYEQQRLADGLPVTVDLIFATGWAPAAAQQQPLRPGSAQTRLATALDSTEQPLPR